MIALVDEAIERYALAHTSPVPALLDELREVTHAQTELPQMQVGPVEGTFLKLLVQLSGARRVVEIGTFTGYSGLMMASGLPDDGRLVTCDVDEAVTAIARDFFDRSGHGHKIEIRLGPALETLSALEGPFDLVFIDADKESYPSYLDAVAPKMPSGALLVADNVLWSGRVADPADRAPSTEALRAFSAKLAADDRFEQVMLTVRDGITLARRV
jgi:caffeoyl-CoA O-methyltransferase